MVPDSTEWSPRRIRAVRPAERRQVQRRICGTRVRTFNNFHAGGVSSVPSLLSVRVKARVRETFALVFSEEAAVAEDNVIDLVARTLSIQSVPFLLRLLALPANK